MIKFKDQDIEIYFKPLENGKCEYEIECHDFGNLECVVNRIVDYKQLSMLLANPKESIKMLRYDF